MILDGSSTLLLNDADVRAVFDWGEAVSALRNVYAASASPAMFPPRTMARAEGLWLRTLSGIMPGQRYLGAKLIVASPRAQAASYLIPLFDQETTALLALLDGNSVTGFRTAATSALAADLLAVPGPRNVAVIGSGFEAQAHLRAVAALGGVGRAVVFSPRPASRAAFVAAMADLPFPVTGAESAEAAVETADLVICAARSRDESPTFLGSWMRPGMTVVSIGSTLPEQRELDAGAIERADLIVADMPEEVVHETGDLIAAAQSGVAFAGKVISMADLVSGRRPGRTSSDQIVIYKSVGAAIQDLAVAAMCVERAAERGLGVSAPPIIQPVDKSK